MYFFPRFAGNEGPTGIPGPVGPSGPKGERGAEGQALSGVTYNRWGRTNCSGDASVVYTGMRITRTQLFRERLSEKVHATIPKGIVSFRVHCPSKKFERLSREVMDICLGVLKESDKSRFDSHNRVKNVLIIFHITHNTFRDCRVQFFPQPFSK